MMENPPPVPPKGYGWTSHRLLWLLLRGPRRMAWG